MRRFKRTGLICAGVLLMAVASAAGARNAPRVVDPAYLATLERDGLRSLPRGLAPFERVPTGLARRGPADAPGGHVRAIAEYEATSGILIDWGGFDALQASMVVPLTTADPPSDVWIVVDDEGERFAALETLVNAGADTAHVHWVLAPSDTVWIRDYGPRFIAQSGTRGIVDHVYNRPRPRDDAIPGVIGNDWGEPVFDLPLVHGGGNFHLFRNRDAFMTRLVVNENPGVDEDAIRAEFRAYEGLDVTLLDPFPTSYDSTQHIDMWMLPLADAKVLIGEYEAAEGAGVPQRVTEDAVTQLSSRGYTVYRTPGWHSGSTHYTYANSVIVNQVVLICRFDGYDDRNAQALATYREAMPDSDIVQVDCSGIIGLAGAVHCIVMHVPDLLFRDDSDDGIVPERPQ